VLRDSTRPLELTRSIQRLFPSADNEWIAAHHVRVAVAVKREDGGVDAIVTLGSRHDGRAYDRRDVSFMAGLASAAAGAWDRELGRTSTIRGVQDREEESAYECPRCGWVAASSPVPCGCRQGATLAGLPHRLAGKFLVERRLGTGGMGVVYLARDVALDRDVALKTLPEVRDGAAARLSREARAMAALNHDGLATLYGLERWRRTPVLVAEYFPEGTLADRLTRGPIAIHTALALGCRLADALVYMHARGVLHRDLKPSNIALTATGSPKLLDFGLATMIEDTGDYPAAGTPAYLPPEAFNGAVPDASFDVWALAVVLFESMAGRRPFSTGAASSRPVEWTPSPDLTRFFDRALSPSIERRFRTAADLRDALSLLAR
jgi:serine/threonine protein kinase